jgi:DNA repair protein RecN (Recombination protein N)
MLTAISVKNFAIIDRLEIEFGPGFNVLTGETGAGKSIILQALNLILGGRAGAEMVRQGAERASVDARFDITGSDDLLALLQEMGFEAEDNILLISRDVSAAGKSACRVCGRPSAVSQLKEIGEWLVDLHGQHEHQSLMAQPKHIEILDAWGSRTIEPVIKQVSEAYMRRQAIRAERDELAVQARERAHLLDLYAFQVNEIQSASLTSGEEEQLTAEHRRAANAQRLSELTAGASEALGGDLRSASATIAAAVRLLEEAAALDPGLEPQLEAVRSAGYELEEAARDLDRYQDRIESDPERLEQIEQRLELLRMLKRKYGADVDEILEFCAQIAAKAAALSNSEERSAELENELLQAEQRLTEEAKALTQLRKKAAAQFEKAVEAELKSLSMEKTRFQVSVEAVPVSARGADRIEFLIATNSGESLKPLSKIASGGEISRIMLAIKTAMARQEALPTMVFDEIDVGVGGRTAVTIADKLCVLAASAQVICITHLAQLACRGVRHHYIEKREEKNRTFVTVTPIEGEVRVREIARMISGSEFTDTVLQHAREMLGAGS